jgi:L-aspartate oxidase
LDTDFLIVGSGIAGLRAAITLAPVGRTLILTKADPSEGNTGHAQGGIAAALGPDDSPALHAADTIRAGDGLCDEEAVAVLVEEGPRYVQELLAWGARFDRDASEEPALGLEAAHSRRRILHAGDATGREIGRTLWQHAVTLRSVDTIHHALVTELVVEDGAVCGVRFFDSSGVSRIATARATLLATGGAGQVFRETTNPGVATGDGVALAAQAGARVADLEFVQFHPTALKRAGAPRFLISEALRGEGARLVNAGGEPFMARYHADGDLAPRDIVARSIVREASRTAADVFLTLAHLDARFVRQRFPTIAEMCRRMGMDLATDPIPVGPAAHYLMGGIDTDTWGRTSIPGLFAAGETACTGVHGANRLASNSLLEGLVFGARAAIAMGQPGQAAALRSDRKVVPLGAQDQMTAEAPERTFAGRTKAAAPEALDIAAIRDLMWQSVGLFRTGPALLDAVRQLDAAYNSERRRGTPSGAGDAYWRRLNLLTVARLIARASLRRLESRGAHFREDFPARDDEQWRFHIVDLPTGHPVGGSKGHGARQPVK